MQAGALFADLRIPLARPDLTDRSCLGDLSQPALASLLAAEGFAGHITVLDDRCTWHRTINWHGVPGRPDTGLMSFDTAGFLIEDGVHAQYRELWQPVQTAPLRGTAVRCGEMTGVLIENDDVFIFGIGHLPVGTTQTLIADLQNGSARAGDLHRVFDSVYVTGTWDGPLGMAHLSTNPFQEGAVALERKGGLVWHALAFDGTAEARALLV